MPSPPENKVTTVVIEMEPGSVFVKIIDPKPAPDQIEFYLRRTIDDWFSAHPQFVIDRTQALIDQGQCKESKSGITPRINSPNPRIQSLSSNRPR